MKPHFRVISWLLAVLGLTMTPATALTTTKHTGPGLLIPAYFYPAGGASDARWAALAAAAREVPLTAILNPSSGPGENTDPNYAQAVSAVRAAGGRVIGYVHTRYGKRSLNEVTAEVNRYINLYDIDGVFIDEMATDNQSANLQYFKSLYELLKAMNPEWVVIGNPGVRPARKHLDLPTADTFVQFEQTGDAWLARDTPDWPVRYGPDRFAELIHSARDESLVGQVIEQAIKRGVGHLYVTNDLMDNPWDELPLWWENLVNQLKNRSALPG